MKESDLMEIARAVPFGQSAFQNVYLADDADTPERKLRYVLLQLDQRLSALKANEFARRRLDVKLRRVQLKLADAEGLDREELQIDADELEHGVVRQAKLIEDCEIEIKTFEAMLEQLLRELPEINRERFEQAERGYWTQRFIAKARREVALLGAPGLDTLGVLEQLGLEVRRDGDALLICGADTKLKLGGSDG